MSKAMIFSNSWFKALKKYSNRSFDQQRFSVTEITKIERKKVDVSARGYYCFRSIFQCKGPYLLPLSIHNSPLWGCAGDQGEMICANFIVGLFLGNEFAATLKMRPPKQSHNALDSYLDSVSRATSKWPLCVALTWRADTVVIHYTLNGGEEELHNFRVLHFHSTFLHLQTRICNSWNNLTWLEWVTSSVLCSGKLW